MSQDQVETVVDGLIGTRRGNLMFGVKRVDALPLLWSYRDTRVDGDYKRLRFFSF